MSLLKTNRTCLMSHRVTLTEAVAYCARYREAPLDTPTKAFAFGREAYDDILAQAGCAQVRSYLGRTAEGEVTLVLVGVDRAGNDMTDGVLMQKAWPCPPYCAAQSPLLG